MWRHPLYGVAAAATAVLVMAAVAGAGVHLVGANQYAQTGPLTAAAVVLGAGGAVDLSLSVDGAPLRVGGDGALALRRTPQVPELAVRTGSAALAFGGGAAAGFLGSMAVDIRGVRAGHGSYARQR